MRFNNTDIHYMDILFRDKNRQPLGNMYLDNIKDQSIITLDQLEIDTYEIDNIKASIENHEMMIYHLKKRLTDAT